MPSFLSKKTITARITICLLIAIIPMSLVAAYFVANGILKDVSAARLEQAGNLYQRPLEALLEHVAEDGRITSAASSFDASAEATEANAIDHAFTELDRLQEKSGVDLQVTPDGLKSRGRDHFAPAILKGEWLSLRSSQSTLSPEDRAARHLQLIADVRGLIAHIGDTSGLILDPDLDSYYLMDSVLVELPQTQDRLAAMRSSYRALANAKKISSEARDQIAVDSALLKQSDIDHVSGDIDTALKEDANFNGVSPTLKPRLVPPYNSYMSANKAALDKIAAFSKSANLGELAGIDESLAHSLHSSFELWQTGSEELDSLLALRISDRHSALGHGLMGMLLAILLPALFAWAVLSRLRRDLISVTQQLHESSSELLNLGTTSASHSQQLSAGASEQAASLEETSAASHEVSSMTRSNAAQSESAASQMVQVEQQMTRLEKDLGEFTDQMNDITTSSTRIASIIKIIHEISFQTNILALNAAVEAARAGEAGMGFAVVADEVRNLAQRCATAATDTEKLIGESIAKAKDGQSQLKKTFANITTIVEAAKDASGLLAAIQQGSQEQVRGVEEISTALKQIEVVTQQAASSAEHGSQTSTELRRNAETLSEVVDSLRSLVSRH